MLVEDKISLTRFESAEDSVPLLPLWSKNGLLLLLLDFLAWEVNGLDLPMVAYLPTKGLLLFPLLFSLSDDPLGSPFAEVIPLLLVLSDKNGFLNGFESENKVSFSTPTPLIAVEKWVTEMGVLTPLVFALSEVGERSRLMSLAVWLLVLLADSGRPF